MKIFWRGCWSGWLARWTSGRGAWFGDALAPAAFELARLYQALELVLQEGFADTASRAYLVLRAKERGLSPRPASPATALEPTGSAVAI